MQIEAAAVKENCGPQMVPIAIPLGIFFVVWVFEFSPSLTALVMR